MRQTAFNADLESDLADVVASSGCELVHLEFAGSTLRVFVDRPEGVTVDDCASVSRELSALLDVHDFGKQRYLLEVSSPGLDRELYRPGDYRRFQGHKVRVTFYTPPPRVKKTITGALEAYRFAGDSDSAGKDAGEISVVEAATGEHYEIPLQDIAVARLEVEL